MSIRILESRAAAEPFLRALEERMPDDAGDVREAVRGIVSDVRARGRDAVLDLRARFEGVGPDVPLVLKSRDLEPLARRCPSETRRVVNLSIARVRAYHDIQREADRSLSEEGGFLASRVQPLDSVALYVPGGKAFYPSSVVMSAVPAHVAGVARVAIFTPARSLEDPVFAATVLALGIDEVIAVGGAQAVATAAYGIEGVERFDKIVGPGNIYVATAKQMLAGRIGIDGFAGPSEILVLGDGTSPATWIAADLLAQAEHDEEASSILVTTSRAEAQAVSEALDALLPELVDREAIARASLARYGAIVVVSDRAGLVDLANTLHAEHLHVHTACALTEEGQAFWMRALRGVGAVFLGRYTAESFGDYLAGPSHVLPTAGTARFASPLGVYDFLRRSSVLHFTQPLARKLAEDTGAFADAEKLWAHALSARMRKGESAP